MDEQTRKVLEAYPVPWTVDVRDTGLVSLLDSTGYALVRMNAARANVEWLTLAATAVNAYAAQAEQAAQVKALVEAMRAIERLDPCSPLVEACYSGVPPKKWIAERTQFAAGYNEARQRAADIARVALAPFAGKEAAPKTCTAPTMRK